jgi:hypothetical protein
VEGRRNAFQPTPPVMWAGEENPSHALFPIAPPVPAANSRARWPAGIPDTPLSQAILFERESGALL